MDKYYHHCDQDTGTTQGAAPEIGKEDLCEEQVQQLLHWGVFERTSERAQPFSFWLGQYVLWKKHAVSFETE